MTNTNTPTHTPSNRAEAERLADRQYTTVTTLDETTTGEPRYVAYSLEVKGCIGSGATHNFARADLLTARADLFETLLNDGLPVPAPYIQSAASNRVVTFDLSEAWWNNK